MTMIASHTDAGRTETHLHNGEQNDGADEGDVFAVHPVRSLLGGVLVCQGYTGCMTGFTHQARVHVDGRVQRFTTRNEWQIKTKSAAAGQIDRQTDRQRDKCPMHRRERARDICT